MPLNKASRISGSLLKRKQIRINRYPSVGGSLHLDIFRDALAEENPQFIYRQLECRLW